MKLRLPRKIKKLVRKKANFNPEGRAIEGIRIVEIRKGVGSRGKRDVLVELKYKYYK